MRTLAAVSRAVFRRLAATILAVNGTTTAGSPPAAALRRPVMRTLAAVSRSGLAEESWKRMLALAEGVRRVIQEQISADEALAVSLAMELNSELPGSVWQGEEAEGAEAVREGAKGPAGGKGRGPLPLGAPQSRAPVPVPAAPQSGAQRHPGTRPLGPPQSGPQRGRPGPGSCPPPRSRKYEGDDGDPDKPVKRSRGGLPAGATRKSAPRRELPLPVRGGPRKDREGAEHEPAAKRSRRCGHCNVHGHDVRNCPDKR